MTLNIRLAGLVMAVFLLAKCSYSIDRALSYNEAIVDAYQRLAEREVMLLYTILNNDTLSYEMNYQLFIRQIEESKKAIEALGPFDENYDDFYLSALRVFDVYEYIAYNDIPKIMAFMSVYYEDPDDDILNEELDNMLIQMDETIDIEFIKFETAQQKFAAKYSFELD